MCKKDIVQDGCLEIEEKNHLADKKKKRTGERGNKAPRKPVEGTLTPFP